MPNRERPAIRRIHFPVEGLVVQDVWRVGKVRIEPVGRLQARITRDVARDPYRDLPGNTVFIELVSRETAALARPTASVVAREPDEARAKIVDAIAILRLFQRTRMPRFSFDKQTFGLQGDIGSTTEDHWITRRGRIPLGGWRRSGVMADFEFTKVDRAAFDSDVRFTYLTDAADAPLRNEWQTRLISALGVLNQATVMVPPTVRTVLIAVALEILLGDERDHRGQMFRLKRRAAYLTCGLPDEPHRPRGRGACFYLEAKSDAALWRAAEDRYRRGQPAACSAFIDYHELLEDRNEFLHGGRVALDHRRAANHERRVDEAIRAALEWVIARGSTGFDDLDAEIESMLPRPALAS